MCNQILFILNKCTPSNWKQTTHVVNDNRLLIFMHFVSEIHVVWKKIKKATLKATEHHKYENIAGSVWLSLFMGSNGNLFYCPRCLAPSWAQLNIITNKQYNFDPSETKMCIWQSTRNLQCGILRLIPFDVHEISDIWKIDFTKSLILTEHRGSHFKHIHSLWSTETGYLLQCSK
jgi:hypothetical protein